MGSSTPSSEHLKTSHRLLLTMAEDLKLPLLQIAREAELVRENPNNEMLESIETAASQALWFIDSYLLSQQVALELEPVTVSSVLNDTAQRLTKLAKQYDCTLELQLSGKYAPVMAHRKGLEAALTGLGTSLIGAVANNEKPTNILLAAHKSRGGVVAGIFTDTDELSKAVLRQGKALYGRARQPLMNLTNQAGAGIFIADSLFMSMQSQLRVARHHKLTGLAATLHPSRQLSLIA